MLDERETLAASLLCYVIPHIGTDPVNHALVVRRAFELADAFLVEVKRQREVSLPSGLPIRAGFRGAMCGVQHYLEHSVSTCTRLRGHSGEHMQHNGDGPEVLDRWETATEPTGQTGT